MTDRNETALKLPMLRPKAGGRVRLDANTGVTVEGIDALDLAVEAPEGPSAAVYITEKELCEWALDVLARFPYESGRELGELIEERRRA